MHTKIIISASSLICHKKSIDHQSTLLEIKFLNFQNRHHLTSIDFCDKLMFWPIPNFYYNDVILF